MKDSVRKYNGFVNKLVQETLKLQEIKQTLQFLSQALYLYWEILYINLRKTCLKFKLILINQALFNYLP